MIKQFLATRVILLAKDEIELPGFSGCTVNLVQKQIFPSATLTGIARWPDTPLSLHL